MLISIDVGLMNKKSTDRSNKIDKSIKKGFVEIQNLFCYD